MACLVALAHTADVLLEGVDALAKRWGLSEAIAGATLAATATSAPELGTTVFALLQGTEATSDIGVGTVVGSAVFNVAAVIGVVALAGKATLTERVVSRDLLAYALSVAALIACMIWLGEEEYAISRFEAAGLLVGYGMYVAWIAWHVRGDRLQAEEQEPDDTLGRALFKLLGGILVIGVACHFLVESARELVLFTGTKLGVPVESVTAVASVVVIAAATSVPDAFTSLAAARQGKTSLAVSNAIGSNTFDVLICLGLPYATVGGKAIAKPIVWSTGYLFGTVALLYVLVRGRVLRRSHGFVFLAVYALFATLVVVGSVHLAK